LVYQLTKRGQATSLRAAYCVRYRAQPAPEPLVRHRRFLVAWPRARRSKTTRGFPAPLQRRRV